MGGFENISVFGTAVGGGREGFKTSPTLVVTIKGGGSFFLVKEGPRKEGHKLLIV